MKKLLSAFAAIIVGTTPIISQPSVDVSVFSRHAWRGQAGPSSPSIQPEIAVPLGQTGTSLSVWGQVPIQGDSTEYDITLSQKVADIGTIAVTSYYYNGPFLDKDNHDIEVTVGASYAGIDFTVGRFINGSAVDGDMWIEAGYDLGGLAVFAGAGDGSYVSEGDGLSLVLLGASATNDEGYGASLLYNVDTETPFIIASKAW